jgi:hypothetical protein
MALPSRPNARIERLLPKLMQSKRLRAEPHRAKLRIANELPSCKKSRTDIADPKRESPSTDIALETRQKLRKLKPLAIVT